MSTSPGHRRRKAHDAHEESTSSLWGSPMGALELPDGSPVLAIRDNLHDLISLGALEYELINTPEFLRLQGIKQLGFCYRIWPGATHTRFEHSLGVYALTLRALRVLQGPRAAQRISLDATTARTLLAAALLHDVGHYPFSHAIEELGGEVLPHELVGRLIIERDPIAGILVRHGLDPSRVAALIARNPAASPPPPVDHVLVRLLSGPLDMDKLDYLPRDARACNVPYGGVDASRLLTALRVISHDGGNVIALDAKGISPFHSLIHARQEMFDNVYWHHTNRAMMAMLLRATQDALDEHALSAMQLTGCDDATLLALLGSDPMPETTQALVGALTLRQPHKVLVEIASRAGRVFNQLDALFWNQAHRKRVETYLARELSQSLGMPVGAADVLVDIPKPEKWQTDVEIVFSRPPVGMSPVMSWTEVTGQQPHDMLIYEQHQRRVRIVGSAWLRERLGEAAQLLILPLLDRLPQS